MPPPSVLVLKMCVTIIIPVYNEKETVLDVLFRVKAADTLHFKKEIIVVDDASTDSTSKLLDEYSDEYSKESGIKVIHLSENSGKASAIKAALDIARGDIILIQDADLEYSPDDYKKLLSPFTESTTMAVYGSRFIQRSWPRNMKIPNWIANKTFTFLVNILYNADITDEGTAYKVFRKDLIKSLNIKSRGFEFCPEVTAKLLKRGIKITEVPVSYNARDKKGGKKPGIADGFKVLWTIIKYRFAEQ